MQSRLFQYFYNKTKVTQKFKILDRRSWSRQHFGNTTVFFLRYPNFQPSSVTAVNTGKLYLNTAGNKESLPTGSDWKALGTNTISGKRWMLTVCIFPWDALTTT